MHVYVVMGLITTFSILPKVHLKVSPFGLSPLDNKDSGGKKLVLAGIEREHTEITMHRFDSLTSCLRETA